MFGKTRSKIVLLVAAMVLLALLAVYLAATSRYDRDPQLIAVKSRWARSGSAPFLDRAYELVSRLRGKIAHGNISGNPAVSWPIVSLFEACQDTSTTRYFIDKDLAEGRISVHQALAAAFSRTNTIPASEWNFAVTNAIALGNVQAEWLDPRTQSCRTSSIALLFPAPNVVLVVPPERAARYAPPAPGH
jgi:hypothetical protein